jgi:hypothetical protein
MVGSLCIMDKLKFEKSFRQGCQSTEDDTSKEINRDKTILLLFSTKLEVHHDVDVCKKLRHAPAN